MSSIQRLICALIVLVGFMPRAWAQTILVPNGDFTLPGINFQVPDNWQLVSGPYCQNVANSEFGLPTNGTYHVRLLGAGGACRSGALSLPSTLGGTISFSWDVGGGTGTSTAAIEAEFLDASLVVISTASTPDVAASVGAFNTINSLLDVPVGAHFVRMRMKAVAGWVSFDNVSSLVFAPPSGGGGGSGCGNPCTINWAGMPGDFTSIGDWENTVALGQAINAIEAELQSFTCPQDLTNRISQVTDTVTSVVSVVASVFGGGGAQVLQLIKILNNARKQLKTMNEQLCELTTQTAIQEAIFEGITVDKETGTVIVHDPAISDPGSGDLGDYSLSTIGSFPTGGDDTVTAVNKTNKLIQAAAVQNAEAWDRALGGQRLDYELDRGPLITQSDITSNEPNLVFAEGDYAQNYSKADELRDAAGVVPAWDKHANLSAQMAEDTVSCLTPEAQPSGTGVELAWATVRWNARQTFAASELGGLLCELVAQRNVAVTGSICLLQGPGFGITVPSFGYWELITPAGYCIAGPSAPSWTAGVWGVLPTITMLMAAFALLKQVI